MAYCHNGGITQHSLADDDSDIYYRLADAAACDAYLLDETVVLVEIQGPELLHVEVSHQGYHLVVDVGSRLKFRTFLGTCSVTAVAQFACCEDGDGLRLADAVILAQLVDGLLAEGVALSTRFIKSTALSFVEPEPISMANNSALLSASEPSAIIFSRGRSSSAH